MLWNLQCAYNVIYSPILPQATVSNHHPLPLGFLLPRLYRPRLRSFLPITPYHNHTQEAAHDCRAKEYQDDGYADGPDARGEEVVERMALVDEGLEAWGVSDPAIFRVGLEQGTISSVHVV